MPRIRKKRSQSKSPVINRQSSTCYFQTLDRYLSFNLAQCRISERYPVLLAASDRSDNANHFGEGARHLGETGQMGDHSSSQDVPRTGIGNIGFPGDVADQLCPPDSDSDLCP